MHKVGLENSSLLRFSPDLKFLLSIFVKRVLTFHDLTSIVASPAQESYRSPRINDILEHHMLHDLYI